MLYNKTLLRTWLRTCLYEMNNEKLLSPGLKVAHTKSKIRYTIVNFSGDDLILKTPEGDKFTVNKKTFEEEYELA